MIYYDWYNGTNNENDNDKDEHNNEICNCTKNSLKSINEWNN